MTDKIKKYLEYTFFIIINFCFTSWGAYIAFMLTGFLATDAIFYIQHTDISTNSTMDSIFIFGWIGIFLLYLMTKPLCFLILYRLKKQFPYIHSFFDRFRLDRKFMWKILGIVLFLDVIPCIILNMCFNNGNFNIQELLQISAFVSLIYNYLIFLLFFHPVKEDKIAEDGTIAQGKIANIMTNIFIWADIVLMIFVFILIALVFIA